MWYIKFNVFSVTKLEINESYKLWLLKRRLNKKKGCKRKYPFWLQMFMFNNPWIAGTISIFINFLFSLIFRAVLQPYIDDTGRKYYHCSGLIFLSILKCISPQIDISAVSPSQNLITSATILCLQSRDPSCNQAKRLHDQRIADILKNSPLLWDMQSLFWCRTMAATRETKSQPRFHARISLTHLIPAKTAIGHFRVRLSLSFKASLSAKFLLW